jgi:hypothetical protein
MQDQGLFDPARLVFIDETPANTKMVRLYGRCAHGECRRGNWKTITFVAGLRRHGVRASQTLDSPTTEKKFPAYVELSCPDTHARITS